jgi:hypothetical protein
MHVLHIFQVVAECFQHEVGEYAMATLCDTAGVQLKSQLVTVEDTKT